MENNLSKKGLDMIKKYEGIRLKAYQDPGGVWTIGYGHTSDVQEDDVITQAQADELFKKDIQKFVNDVNRLVKVDLNQNQFDALVSFTYNCGSGALQRSNLLKYTNEKKFTEAAKEFDKWTRADGKVLKGLELRRNEEQALFLQPVVDATQPLPDANPKPVTNPKPAVKTISQLADEVIKGKHGNGRERMISLGVNYTKVQQEVNRRMREK